MSKEKPSKYLGILERFPAQTVLVVGDLVADEFVLGEISRVSREAAVLILKHRQTQILPGGGANAAYNLADLGAQVIPVGMVGDDAAGGGAAGMFSPARGGNKRHRSGARIYHHHQEPHSSGHGPRQPPAGSEN